MLDGVDYVSQFMPQAAAAKINYRLALVPEGRSAEVRSTSLTLFGGPQPLYVEPWSSDRDANRANIVDTFAHESLHLRAGLAGLPEQKVADEDMASLAGACAQLNKIGVIKAKYELHAALVGPGVDHAVTKSTAALAHLGATLFPSFDFHDAITRDSERGRQLTKRCRSDLIAFFR